MDYEKEILALRADLADAKREFAALKKDHGELLQRLGPPDGSVDTRTRLEKKVDAVVAVIKSNAAVVESWLRDV